MGDPPDDDDNEWDLYDETPEALFDEAMAREDRHEALQAEREAAAAAASPQSGFLVKPSVTSAIARPRTYLNMVLDKSSSMEKVREETIEAYNAFLKGQRTDRVDELFVTLTQFSDRDQIAVTYRVTPVADVRALDLRTYVPCGSTALYDGLVRTCAAMEREVGPLARVLTVVLTDGRDNASREVKSARELAATIQAYERRGNWTFVLMAADLDAYKAGASMGFKPGNVQSYAAAHVTEALATVARGVTVYRHGDQMQTGEFFTARKFARTQWVQDEATDPSTPSAR